MRSICRHGLPAADGPPHRVAGIAWGEVWPTSNLFRRTTGTGTYFAPCRGPRAVTKTNYTTARCEPERRLGMPK